MYFRGKDRTLFEILNKSVCYIPKRIQNYTHDYYVYKQIVRIMFEGGKPSDEIASYSYLSRTLSYAYKNIPYFHEFSFLSDVTTLNVLKKLKMLPLLDKELIRSQGDRMHLQIDLTNSGMGHTGGTTGKPLDFYYGRADERSHQIALYEYMTGIKFKGNFDVEGAIVSFGGTRLQETDIFNHVYWQKSKPGIYGSYDFSNLYMLPDNIYYYFQKLKEINPKILRGYSNTILKLAKFYEEAGFINIHPLAIYVTSEYCSLDSMKYISSVFNCPVYGQYGQNEACHFAWTEANSDVYYCSPYYGFVEVVDENGDWVKEGDFGEVVVTSFGNKTQPFIRYKTGDYVRYGGRHNGIVILDKLIGRNSDYLINSDNEKVYTAGIVDIHYLNCQSRILQFQIEQTVPGKVVFKIVRKKGFSMADEKELFLLMKSIKITPDFKYMDSIPLTPRGKEKHIVQHIKKNVG